MTLEDIWIGCAIAIAFGIISGWSWIYVGAIAITVAITFVAAIHVAVDRFLAK